MTHKRESHLYVWPFIENIATLTAIVILFIYSNSVWCFLLLLNLNSVKSETKTIEPQ